jgi:hypothetical protein
MERRVLVQQWHRVLFKLITLINLHYFTILGVLTIEAYTETF